ncbi:hypothetical protein GCM10007908_17620 [Rhizobium albus]|nr:hypothetical protein GCM10007908_17620 [Rhizobium albus]
MADCKLAGDGICAPDQCGQCQKDISATLHGWLSLDAVFETALCGRLLDASVPLREGQMSNTVAIRESLPHGVAFPYPSDYRCGDLAAARILGRKYR